MEVPPVPPSPGLNVAEPTEACHRITSSITARTKTRWSLNFPFFWKVVTWLTDYHKIRFQNTATRFVNFHKIWFIVLKLRIFKLKSIWTVPFVFIITSCSVPWDPPNGLKLNLDIIQAAPPLSEAAKGLFLCLQLPAGPVGTSQSNNNNNFNNNNFISFLSI